MPVTLARPIWTTDFESETINRLIAQHALNLPTQRLAEPRPVSTPDEIETFYRFRISGGAHDLLIVQVIAKAINQIVPDDPHLQLFLSRQLGDDGAHAEHTRQRVWQLSGHDPIAAIQAQAKKHWDYLGDFPLRNWVSFIAWELHYELHIVAASTIRKRLARLTDPVSADFIRDRILPDEFVHRVGVVEWWQSKYDNASPKEKAELAEQLIALDDEGQRRRNDYLHEHWQLTYEALDYQSEGFEILYDAWRKEVLSYLLDIPVARLPKLVSVRA